MTLSFHTPIPLSLYIHFPWCVKKCPYCDFNSHALVDNLPENEYIDALLLNLEKFLPLVWGRSVISIFMGGGTPSLFSPEALDKLLQGVRARIRLKNELEITLEANPGTVEQQKFKAYREIGINRLSLGVQSFNNKHLKALGRIHDSHEALNAIECIKKAGFDNFNIDLMFGLPEQSLEEGLNDLDIALMQHPSHLSWYELTLEPNTYFWHHPPTLPQDEHIWDLQTQGQALLDTHGYKQYEVSAYAQEKMCQHNLNYWEFGDYLAIGAGSHAKITDMQQQNIVRYQHFRHPKQYMDISKGFVQASQLIPRDQLMFEFMLNALRLKQGVPLSYFSERTGLAVSELAIPLQQTQEKGWISVIDGNICATPVGYRFLNDVVSSFMLEECEHEY